MREVSGGVGWLMPATFSDVFEELQRASKQHTPISCEYEGYALIQKQVDDLWTEIKKRKPNRDMLRKEAVQVAAMACRFINDLLPKEAPVYEPAGEEE